MISDNAVCRAPKRVGHCEDEIPTEIPRFYYNQETDLCEEFNWSGCNENRNNFETKEECETACLNEGMYNAFTIEQMNKPRHEISNVVCATSKASDQPAHARSLIRAFASRLNIL